MLNRAYRREAQVTLEAHVHISRRTAEDVQNHWAVSALPSQSTLAKVEPEPPPRAEPEQEAAAATPVSSPEPAAKPSLVPELAPDAEAVTGVLDTPLSAEAKAEASRLLKALADTSELEAVFALMSPEQFQAFLKRLRQRTVRCGGSDDAS